MRSRELGIELLGDSTVTVGGAEVSGDAWRRREPAAVVELPALAPGPSPRVARGRPGERGRRSVPATTQMQEGDP